MFYGLNPKQGNYLQIIYTVTSKRHIEGILLCPLSLVYPKLSPFVLYIGIMICIYSSNIPPMGIIDSMTGILNQKTCFFYDKNI